MYMSDGMHFRNPCIMDSLTAVSPRMNPNSFSNRFRLFLAQLTTLTKLTKAQGKKNMYPAHHPYTPVMDNWIVVLEHLMPQQTKSDRSSLFSRRQVHGHLDVRCEIIMIHAPSRNKEPEFMRHILTCQVGQLTVQHKLHAHLVSWLIPLIFSPNKRYLIPTSYQNACILICTQGAWKIE